MFKVLQRCLLQQWSNSITGGSSLYRVESSWKVLPSSHWIQNFHRGTWILAILWRTTKPCRRDDSHSASCRSSTVLSLIGISLTTIGKSLCLGPLLTTNLASAAASITRIWKITKLTQTDATDTIAISTINLDIAILHQLKSRFLRVLTPLTSIIIATDDKSILSYSKCSLDCTSTLNEFSVR